VRHAGEGGVHPAGIVQIANGVVRKSLFAKVEKPDYRGGQDIQREFHYLANIGPLITAEHPTLRSPQPISYDSVQRLLLMEFVPGDSLKHCTFDLTRNQIAKDNLTELLQQVGRWLGSFHRLTLQSTSGNPLEWLLQEFTKKRTLDAFVLYSMKETYDEMLSILKRCLTLKPAFQRKQCVVHGEFTPIHVMDANGAIYVVDFGNSRVGYPYEDVGLFQSFYDCLFPWRAFIGSSRIRLRMQKELFLQGYFEQSAVPFSNADRAIMRWVRLISFARMLHGGKSRYAGWGGWAYSQLARCTLRANFIRLCQTELAALKVIPPDVFQEDPYTKRRPNVAETEDPLTIAHSAD
jgi:aminoglycoside phosphotransferase (APT) family kinase protein